MLCKRYKSMTFIQNTASESKLPKGHTPLRYVYSPNSLMKKRNSLLFQLEKWINFNTANVLCDYIMSLMLTYNSQVHCFVHLTFISIFTKPQHLQILLLVSALLYFEKSSCRENVRYTNTYSCDFVRSGGIGSTRAKTNKRG